MDSSYDLVYRAARREYELGRLRDAVIRAVPVVLLAAVVGKLTIGRAALVWLPVPFVVSVFTEWRGKWWMKGARRGLVAGFVSLVVPLSILRPCCGSNPGVALGATCCTMPLVCWVTGGALGLALSLALPRHGAGHKGETALGMLLGVTSITVLRCSALFVAEAAGLLGGLLAGVVAASFARALLDRTRVTA